MCTHSQVCQKADIFYSCGDTTQPIVLWDYYYELGDPKKIKNADFPGFQIQYPWGTSWRYIRIPSKSMPLDDVDIETLVFIR